MSGRDYIWDHAEDVRKLCYGSVCRYVWPRFGPTLRSRYDLDDVVAECVVHVFEYAEAYDPERQKLSTWIYRVAPRHALSRIVEKELRKKRAPDQPAYSLNFRYDKGNGARGRNGVELLEMVRDDIDLEADYMDAEDVVRAKKALEKCTPYYADALWAYCQDGATLQSVGARFGVGRERARQLVEKGRRQVRMKMMGEER